MSITLSYYLMHKQYNATSIIWTSFIPNLDYLTSKYITTYAQKAWLMIFCGHGDRLSNELDRAPDLAGLKLIDPSVLSVGYDHTINYRYH